MWSLPSDDGTVAVSMSAPWGYRAAGVLVLLLGLGTAGFLRRGTHYSPSGQLLRDGPLMARLHKCPLGEEVRDGEVLS